MRNAQKTYKSTRRLQEEYQDLYDNSPAGFLSIDVKFNIVKYNRTAEKLLGIKSPQTPIADLVHREDRRKILSYLKKIITSRTKKNTLIRLKKPVYKNVYALFAGIPVLDKDNKVNEIRTVLSEVTLGRQSEELKRKNEKLEALAGISAAFSEIKADLNSALDYTVKILSELYNDACVIRLLTEDKRKLRSLAYYHPDERVRSMMHELFTQSTDDPLNSLAYRVITEGKPLLIENPEDIKSVVLESARYKKYIDSYNFSSILAVPLKVEGGVIGMISLSRRSPGVAYKIDDQVFLSTAAGRIATAISNNLLHQANLKEIKRREVMQEALFSQQELLKNILDTIPVGVWVFDQDGRRLITNRGVKEIWGTVSYDTPKDLKKLGARWTDSGEPVKEDEWASERALKGEAVFNQKLTIECKDGVHKTIFNSAVPVKKNGEILGAIVVNVDITDLKNNEDALRKTLLELEGSHKDLEQFAYVASHDFLESLGRMQNQVHDFLSYARVIAKPAPFSPVDINSVVDEAVHELDPLITVSGAEITYSRLPVINADPGQIKQLFRNLLEYALKSWGEVRPEVKISASKNKEQSKEVWTFSLSSNAPGILTEDQEKIFTIRPRSGTGLALCRRIVEHHGGRIWFESQQGAETIFYFTLNS